MPFPPAALALALPPTPQVACPALGLEGTVFDASQYMPPILRQVDLNNLGPMMLPRLWSAIHDALVFIDPGQASGGAAAAKLARRLSRQLSALCFDAVRTRDLQAAAGLAADPSSRGERGPHPHRHWLPNP